MFKQLNLHFWQNTLGASLGSAILFSSTLAFAQSDDVNVSGGFFDKGKISEGMAGEGTGPTRKQIQQQAPQTRFPKREKSNFKWNPRKSRAQSSEWEASMAQEDSASRQTPALTPDFAAGDGSSRDGDSSIMQKSAEVSEKLKTSPKEENYRAPSVDYYEGVIDQVDKMTGTQTSGSADKFRF